MARIIYSPKYNIGFFGLERIHPFDSRKYGRAWSETSRRIGAKAQESLLRTDRQATWNELKLVHTDPYLLKLRDSKYVAKALELPQLAQVPNIFLDRYLLRPMRWATRGTMLAAEQAIDAGVAINLAGGFHHAKPRNGEGFCIYADIAIAVEHLRKSGKIDRTDRVLYVDADAHQGNGVSYCFRDDRSVFIYDIYNSFIYPCDVDAIRRIDCDVPLAPSDDWASYREKLKSTLPGFLDSVANNQTKLAIYNAGTDIVEDDPLGMMNVSPEGVLERDLYIIGQLRERGIPTLMLLSGGYTKQSFSLVAATVSELLIRY